MSHSPDDLRAELHKAMHTIARHVSQHATPTGNFQSDVHEAIETAFHSLLVNLDGWGSFLQFSVSIEVDSDTRDDDEGDPIESGSVISYPYSEDYFKGEA